MPKHHLTANKDPESLRICNDPIERSNWKLWGPYLSERQWGTVREDYSENGAAWESFPREQAGSRAYRWGEDGLMGWSDRHGQLCFSVTLWNEQDDILKERLFGLTNHEGNHGEDVKELYYYLDSTPTHSFARSLYKYPQRKFPYQEIISINKKRDRLAPEYELEDTGIFSEGRYFDVETTYSKAGPEDLLIEIKATNRGPDTAPLVLLPTLWFRNTWSWGREGEDMTERPEIRQNEQGFLETHHEKLPAYQLAFEDPPELWFTDNETHRKDAFSRHLLKHEKRALREDKKGTKSAGYYRREIESGETAVIRLRLTRCESAPAPDTLFGADFSAMVATRSEEADQFYAARIPENVPTDERRIMRQAYAGLLCSKPFYHFIVNDWLD